MEKKGHMQRENNVKHEENKKQRSALKSAQVPRSVSKQPFNVREFAASFVGGGASIHCFLLVGLLGLELLLF